ncbi:unnamed protein product [Cochlearia groenlandica]
MCRSPDFERYIEKESLKVKAFFVRFTGLTKPTRESLPDSLTLLYPPRINEAAFELEGSKIRPDSPAFVTLHRVVKGGEAIYGSRERVRVWEGIRFEVYMSEERVIKGIFRKDEERDDDDEWKLECECEMEEGMAEVVVATEGHVATSTMARRHRKRKGRIGFECMEEIPEEREEGRGELCFCTCDRGGGESDDGELEAVEWTAEMETEGMGWAVDLGIWVVCLGVGYLVSKASSKTLRSGSSSRRRRTRTTFF